MATPREKLITLHRDFYGSRLEGDETELEMIVDILGQLIEESNEQKDHSHSIS